MRRSQPGAYARIFTRGDHGADHPGRGMRAENPTADTSNGEIWLYDVIDPWADDWWGGVSAAMMVAALQDMGGAPVTVHVNSPGGAVFEAIAMASTFRQYAGTVTMRIEGLAASAASFVAVAGDRVVVDPNAMVMIHDAWDIAVGDAAELRKQADLLDKASDNIASMYQAKAGGDVGQWRARMLEETWYTGQEVVDVGLADEVVAAKGGGGAGSVSDRWDLGVFGRAPGTDGHTPATARHPITPPTSGEDVTSVNDQAARYAAFQAQLKGMAV